MISFNRLREMPDQAKLWLYAASRTLTDAEAGQVQNQLDRFFRDWSSHGRAVVGTADISERRIVAIAAHVPDGDLSGCGIDKSVHVLEQLETRLGISWTSGLSIAYRDADGAIQLVSRPTFRAAVRSGVIQGDTPVIDLSLTDVNQLEHPGIERRAAESWHASVFGIEERSEVV
jgi:hypothetical protein